MHVNGQEREKIYFLAKNKLSLAMFKLPTMPVESSGNVAKNVMSLQVSILPSTFQHDNVKIS